jgi:hypothetical protein
MGMDEKAPALTTDDPSGMPNAETIFYDHDRNRRERPRASE